METTNRTCETRWTGAWSKLDAAPPADAYVELASRYAEPHRAYHNLQHVGHCLLQMDAVEDQLTAPGAVELAIWFHDVVYDPHASENEEQSALLAAGCLRAAGVSDAVAGAMGDLIRATDHRTPPADQDTAFLLDIDLAILAAPEPAFWEYEDAIRREYASVPDEAFRQGRATVLEKFLQRPAIFATEHFADRWEAAARANLQESIRRLQS